MSILQGQFLCSPGVAPTLHISQVSLHLTQVILFLLFSLFVTMLEMRTVGLLIWSTWIKQLFKPDMTRPEQLCVAHSFYHWIVWKIIFWVEVKVHFIPGQISDWKILLLQLIDMRWKLSVGVSSSSCRSLNSPYVTVQITVSDPSGNPSTQSFEMTVSEFKVRTLFLYLWTF